MDDFTTAKQTVSDRHSGVFGVNTSTTNDGFMSSKGNRDNLRLPAQMYGMSPNVNTMDMKGYSTTTYSKNEMMNKKKISGPLRSIDSSQSRKNAETRQESTRP